MKNGPTSVLKHGDIILINATSLVLYLDDCKLLKVSFIFLGFIDVVVPLKSFFFAYILRAFLTINNT